MKLVKITAPAAVLLWKMLNAPREIPDVPYKAPDDVAALEITRINRWLTDPKTKLISVSVGPGGMSIAGQPRDVEVKDRFVERMKQVCKHYENGGRLAQNCAAYMELQAGLDGRALEIEDVEDVKPEVLSQGN
jgi:hypothetical protein